MSRDKREQERKQENRENQEISNIENSYETIIEKDTQKYNRYAQIRKTETKYETKKTNPETRFSFDYVYRGTQLD